MISDTVRDPWVASDATVAAIDTAQYTLGEGPTQDAYAARRPVLVPDLDAAWVRARWPMLVAELEPSKVGGLFALPMRIGAITVGVCTAYRRDRGRLTEPDLAELLGAMDDATLTLLGLRSGSSGNVSEAAPSGGTLPRGDTPAPPTAGWWTSLTTWSRAPSLTRGSTRPTCRGRSLRLSRHPAKPRSGLPRRTREPNLACSDTVVCRHASCAMV